MSEVSYPESAVGQSGSLFDCATAVLPGNGGRTVEPAKAVSYPEKPVGQRCPTPKRRLVGQQAKARASAPFALTRFGGTPMPGAAVSNRRPKERVTGRPAGGPACIGCTHFSSVYTDGFLTGRGVCAARDDRPVAAHDRRPCGLYDFSGPGRAIKQPSFHGVGT
jgi:hypothetical protein